jgi:hypothetical protein
MSDGNPEAIFARVRAFDWHPSKRERTLREEANSGTWSLDFCAT